MTIDENTERENDIKDARRNDAQANARKADFEAKKAEQEMLHEQEKIKKTIEETKKAEKSTLLEGAKVATASIGILAAGVALLKNFRK